jgi:peptidylprolyl isomerase
MVRITPEIQVTKWDGKGKDTVTTASGLRYIVFDTGTGGLIKPNIIVTVHYSTFTLDGKLIDSSVKREEPLKFPVGAGLVIEGWDEAAQLMRWVQNTSLLFLQGWAYGSVGALPEVAPNTDLIFDIEVLEVMQ